MIHLKILCISKWSMSIRSLTVWLITFLWELILKCEQSDQICWLPYLSYTVPLLCLKVLLRISCQVNLQVVALTFRQREGILQKHSVFSFKARLSSKKKSIKDYLIIWLFITSNYTEINKKNKFAPIRVALNSPISHL